METYKRIGKIIQEYRTKKEMSQDQLGKELGYTATAISYFENGLRKISIDDLHKVANILGIPMTLLLPGSETQIKQSDYLLKLRAQKNLSPRAQESVIEFINFVKQKSKHSR